MNTRSESGRRRLTQKHAIWALGGLVLLGCVLLTGRWLIGRGDAGARAVSNAGRVERAVHEFRPKGSSSGPAIRLEVERRVHQPPLVVEELSQADWDRSTPESSYRGYYSANRSGDYEWILRTWVPEERAAARAEFGDPANFERNRRIFADIRRSEIRQTVFYGDYVILRTLHSFSGGFLFPMKVTFKRTPEGWLVTNALKDDRVFQNLIEALDPFPSGPAGPESRAELAGGHSAG